MVGVPGEQIEEAAGGLIRVQGVERRGEVRGSSPRITIVLEWEPLRVGRTLGDRYRNRPKTGAQLIGDTVGQRGKNDEGSAVVLADNGIVLQKVEQGLPVCGGGMPEVQQRETASVVVRAKPVRPGSPVTALCVTDLLVNELGQMVDQAGNHLGRELLHIAKHSEGVERTTSRLIEQVGPDGWVKASGDPEEGEPQHPVMGVGSLPNPQCRFLVPRIMGECVRDPGP